METQKKTVVHKVDPLEAAILGAFEELQNLNILLNKKMSKIFSVLDDLFNPTEFTMTAAGSFKCFAVNEPVNSIQLVLKKNQAGEWVGKELSYKDVSIDKEYQWFRSERLPGHWFELSYPAPDDDLGWERLVRFQDYILGMLHKKPDHLKKVFDHFSLESILEATRRGDIRIQETISCLQTWKETYGG